MGQYLKKLLTYHLSVLYFSPSSIQRKPVVPLGNRAGRSRNKLQVYRAAGRHQDPTLGLSRLSWTYCRVSGSRAR